MIVYHGSDHIIERPTFHGGKRTNDYGYGFYTTKEAELASEWACAKNTDGYVNSYDLEIDGLKVLNLNDGQYNILNWLAILTRYRSYWESGSISEQAKQYLHDNFYLDVEQYDVVIGYRADDSYFSFARDFVAGTISLRKLSEAMRLGKLGEQIVLKSQQAYTHITFAGSEHVDGGIYYDKKIQRDREARRQYRAVKAGESLNDLYMIDIMREGMKNGDPRLQ